MIVWSDPIFVSWLVNLSLYWCREWLNDGLTDGLIIWLNSWLINLFIDWLVDWLIEWLIAWLNNYFWSADSDWLIDWLFGSLDWWVGWLLVDWLIDWFSDCWLINSSIDKALNLRMHLVGTSWILKRKILEHVTLQRVNHVLQSKSLVYASNHIENSNFHVRYK